MRSSSVIRPELGQSDNWFGPQKLPNNKNQYVWSIPTGAGILLFISIIRERDFNRHRSSARLAAPSFHFTEEEVMVSKDDTALPKGHDDQQQRPSLCTGMSGACTLGRSPVLFSCARKVSTPARSAYLPVGPTGDDLELFRVVTNALE